MSFQMCFDYLKFGLHVIILLEYVSLKKKKDQCKLILNFLNQFEKLRIKGNSHFANKKSQSVCNLSIPDVKT